jgi:hypothetical protein
MGHGLRFEPRITRPFYSARGSLKYKVPGVAAFKPAGPARADCDFRATPGLIFFYSFASGFQ